MVQRGALDPGSRQAGAARCLLPAVGCAVDLFESVHSEHPLEPDWVCLVVALQVVRTVVVEAVGQGLGEAAWVVEDRRAPGMGAEAGVVAIVTVVAATPQAGVAVAMVVMVAMMTTVKMHEWAPVTLPCRVRLRYSAFDWPRCSCGHSHARRCRHASTNQLAQPRVRMHRTWHLSGGWKRKLASDRDDFHV
eukprot:1991003-Prymnesium_polylepis.1